MKALTDTDHRVMLREVTEAQCDAAVAMIARHATSRADLAELLAMVAPMPYSPVSSPSVRRALPRRSA